MTAPVIRLSDYRRAPESTIRELEAFAREVREAYRVPVVADAPVEIQVRGIEEGTMK